MPQAITAMLQAHGGLYQNLMRKESRSIGTRDTRTGSFPQRSTDRVEQVATDRLPSRRGLPMAAPDAHAQRSAEPKCRPWGYAQDRTAATYPRQRTLEAPRTGRLWQALDQALRATDMLLQGGGFSAIVLDLGSTPAELAWRIPLATWFRFRAACEHGGVSLLLLTQHPCARSSAELVVRMEPGSLEADGKVMTGVQYHAAVERKRFAPSENKLVSTRRPPSSERAGRWRSEAVWARAK